MQEKKGDTIGMMGKEWIERKQKWMNGWIILAVFLAVVLCGFSCCSHEMTGAETQEWEKQSSTAVASQTYRDDAGNEIIYYCCRTIYYDEQGQTTTLESTDSESGQSVARESVESENGLQLNQEALQMVIDLDRAEGQRECTVGDWPAILCQQDGCAYLCWTISPEYSCVIEYYAEAVAEEDIFRMAESVTQQKS